MPQEMLVDLCSEVCNFKATRSIGPLTGTCTLSFRGLLRQTPSLASVHLYFSKIQHPCLQCNFFFGSGCNPGCQDSHTFTVCRMSSLAFITSVVADCKSRGQGSCCQGSSCASCCCASKIYCCRCCCICGSTCGAACTGGHALVIDKLC